MYCRKNFATKKALKDAVAAGQKVSVFNPGLGEDPPQNGDVTLEGPHYPQPHKWYATATLKEGYIVKVK